MAINTPNTHVSMVDGTTPAGQLLLPWSLPSATQIANDYQNAQAALARNAVGNLVAMNGRGSGPSD